MVNKSFKSKKKSWDSTTHTFLTPLKPLIKTPKVEIFISFKLK
jgi:hypothetical protein